MATTETDEALGRVLNKHLASCLVKLSSSEESVRKKVMELLVHVNKRVKNNENVQLPIEALLQQYQDPSVSSFVTNFTIIYIKMGFPRMPLDEKIQIIPRLLIAIDGKPAEYLRKCKNYWRVGAAYEWKLDTGFNEYFKFK